MSSREDIELHYASNSVPLSVIAAASVSGETLSLVPSLESGSVPFLLLHSGYDPSSS